MGVAFLPAGSFKPGVKGKVTCLGESEGLSFLSGKGTHLSRLLCFPEKTWPW